MTREDLDRLVDETPDGAVPELVGELARAWARALGRVTVPRAPAPAPSDELLTMDVVAQRLGIHEWTAREMGRRGELGTVHVGDRGIRVRESALAEYVRKRERGATMPRGRG